MKSLNFNDNVYSFRSLTSTTLPKVPSPNFSCQWRIARNINQVSIIIIPNVDMSRIASFLFIIRPFPNYFKLKNYYFGF
ncbi:hypothetical protein BpHYR1_021739 [Brachionus plicatilis]|uniref:Uncharacterized protein n=1 Tax=Brachionus plicatilis TaxID=10195 RepID=A0A3M7RWU9_BRAPC|nr:hypothetical protein BpHYR1_021739 [Brachionus plicatilis]